MDDLAAILFDTFGTVVDWRTSLIADFTAWGEACNLRTADGGSPDWAGLVDAWRGAYVPAMDQVRRAVVPWTVLDDLHRTSLDTLLPRFGLAAINDASRTWLVLGWHRLRPWPDAMPGLTRLRRRFAIAPLSNGNVALLMDMARAAAIPWDMIFGADLFGHYKPDPETYLGACRLLGLPPRRVMMAAAHNGDLAAARALGLRTAFFPRRTEYGAGQARDLGPEGPWDVVAADIADLATRLGA